MKLKDKYQLKFKRKIESLNVTFHCNSIGDSISQNIARKINQMNLQECKGLIEEIENAQNGKYFEEYFSLDRDESSDEDEIRILPPNVILNISTKIPLEEMKSLLLEWQRFNENLF
jgi:hypothetical protein